MQGKISSVPLWRRCLREKLGPRHQHSPARAGVRLLGPLKPGTGSQRRLEMERDGKGGIGPRYNKVHNI